MNMKKLALTAALTAALTLGGATAAFAYPVPPSGVVTLPAGGTQTLTFTGFPPGSAVFVVIPDATSIALAAEGRFEADDKGEVNIVATFEEAGRFPVQVYAGDSATGTPVVDSTLVVTEVPRPAPAPSPSEEPTDEATDIATSAPGDGGFDAAPWIWGGVGVLAVAGIATGVGVAAKRRRDAA